jgi:hypothetical protein
MPAEPLLSSLLPASWLHFNCTFCGREPRMMNAYEVCFRYGHDLKFSDLRAVVKARCARAEKCGVNIGRAMDHMIPRTVEGKIP